MGGFSSVLPVSCSIQKKNQVTYVKCKSDTDLDPDQMPFADSTSSFTRQFPLKFSVSRHEKDTGWKRRDQTQVLRFLLQIASRSSLSAYLGGDSELKRSQLSFYQEQSGAWYRKHRSSLMQSTAQSPPIVGEFSQRRKRESLASFKERMLME